MPPAGFWRCRGNAFVAAFVFYVVVTLVAIGVEQLPDAPMIAAYSLPVVAYAGIILSRALRGAAALTFHVGPAAIPKIV